MTGARAEQGLPGTTRPGFALVFSILLMMGLALLTAGMLAVADQETRIAATLTGTTRARAAAESGIRRALADWSTRRAAALMPGEGWTGVDSLGGEVRLRRLHPTLFLLTARVSGPDGAVGSAGVLVRTLDVPALVAAARGAAAVAGRAELHGGLLSGTDACADGAGDVPALVADSVVRTGGETRGAAGAVEVPPAALPPLPYAEMAAIRLAGGTGIPRPAATGGACVESDWGWGSVSEGHPCAAPHLIHSTGDLAVTGGQGVGVLVVDGDLELGGGFTFHGLILATGTVLLEDAVVRGAIRAASLDVRDGLLQYDSCLLSAAFAAPAFDRAFRPPDRWWLPTF